MQSWMGTAYKALMGPLDLPFEAAFPDDFFGPLVVALRAGITSSFGWIETHIYLTYFRSSDGQERFLPVDFSSSLRAD
jgi:hypothetical protein